MWHNFRSTAERSEITKDISDTPLVYEHLGENLVVSQANIEIMIDGEQIKIGKVAAAKMINVIGPTLQTNNNLFIKTIDDKFINVRREING